MEALSVAPSAKLDLSCFQKEKARTMAQALSRSPETERTAQR
jgi:hypothetical protein